MTDLRRARLAGLLRRILHSPVRKAIAGALALAAIVALGWHGFARRFPDADDDRDEDRDGDEDAERRMERELTHRRRPEPPGRWLDITAPAFSIPPGANLAYCFVTHLPNTEPLAIRRWRSRMSGGIRDIVVFLGGSAASQAPEVRPAPCDRLVAPRPDEALAYISHATAGDFELPPNDGAGHPVAQLAEPGALLVVELQIVNPTERTLPAQLELHVEAADRGAVVTPMSSVIAFHNDLHIPAGSATAPGTLRVTGSCAVPADMKLFGVSSYTHHRGVHTFVKDGTTTLVDSARWDYPAMQAWWTGYAVKSGTLEYGCEYRNPTAQPVSRGGLPDDELCVIVGYVFPAPRSLLCPN
ncbi:MAG TPA: hypothetical protein VHW23_48215 [Kofleriaceae bacterium]|nr:hypothetical protein [Kofleriaceae bacterium]